MIREVAEIPEGRSRWLTGTKRAAARADINEAIAKGISRFEFVGEIYEAKNMYSNVRETAIIMNREIIEHMAKSEAGDDEDLAFAVIREALHDRNLWPIRVTSTKSDKPDARRIFCWLKSEAETRAEIRETIRQERRKMEKRQEWEHRRRVQLMREEEAARARIAGELEDNKAP